MTLCTQDSSSTDKHLLQQNILNSLGSAPGDSTVQCHHLQPFLSGMKKEACKIILHNLVQLNFTQDNACEYWEAIVTHAEKMQISLDRKVGLATAACDYFSTIQPYLNNPKLIEFTRFEETLQSAQQDFLTGLLSRGAFQQSFEQEISRAKRHNHNATLIFLDLDNFKRINDRYGHPAGDEALKQVGKILLNSKRKEDIACRFGGDEFVILLPETNKLMGLQVGKKLLDQINTLVVHHEGEKIQISCSGGLAAFPLDSHDGQELISCADRALYQAKSRGKHELNLFSEEKRTFTRIDFDHPVTIRSLEIKKKDGDSKSTNISEGGILISSNNRYSIGSRLELQIPLKKGSHLTLTGSVVRVEQFDSDHYDIGLSFLHLDPSSTTPTQAIADHILQQLTY
jgi:diguanylate cyclase (GGDEF)-like protein